MENQLLTHAFRKRIFQKIFPLPIGPGNCFYGSKAKLFAMLLILRRSPMQLHVLTLTLECHISKQDLYHVTSHNLPIQSQLIMPR